MKNLTLVSLFEKMVAFHEKSERLSDKRSFATIRTYKIKLTILFTFLQEIKSININSVDFDKNLTDQYYLWLLKKYKNNYAVRCVEIVVRALRFGVENELIEKNPITYYKLKKTPPEKPTYFNPMQMKLFEDYKNEDENKTKTSHLAVLQMHTGFDYGDFKEIKREHILLYKGRKFIIKPRQKNGNEAIIPLSHTAENILEFYNYKMNILSNPTYNGLLKDVATDLGINISLKSKSMRKIFLMDQLNNKCVPIAAVSKMAGHKRIKTTEEFYAQVNINLISNELDRLGL